MGFQCIRGHRVGHNVYEVTIKESTDIAQLMCSGDMFIMDRKDLDKAKDGLSVFAGNLNLETGKVTINKYSKLPEGITDAGWVDYIWSRSFESERDWS